MPTVRANRTNELLGVSSRSIPRRTRPVPIARVVPIPTRITAAVRTRVTAFTVRPYTGPRLRPPGCLHGSRNQPLLGFVDQVDQLRQGVEPVLAVAVEFRLECGDACVAVLT